MPKFATNRNNAQQDIFKNKFTFIIGLLVRKDVMKLYHLQLQVIIAESFDSAHLCILLLQMFSKSFANMN